MPARERTMPPVNTIICTECGRGQYVRVTADVGVCDTCPHTVRISRDITPNLDEGETLTLTVRGFLGYFSAS